MALNVIVAPFLILPFLVLMNDTEYLDEHTNGWPGNIIVLMTTVLAFVLALVAIPLQIFGGG
jgi:Mn2+/Fe2+ NRAMP family transporter